MVGRLRLPDIYTCPIQHILAKLFGYALNLPAGTDFRYNTQNEGGALLYCESYSESGV